MLLTYIHLDSRVTNILRINPTLGVWQDLAQRLGPGKFYAGHDFSPRATSRFSSLAPPRSRSTLFFFIVTSKVSNILPTMAQSMVPVATWGLTVAPNGEAEGAFGIDTPPGTLQLTMAAIDPDEDIAGNESTEKLKKPRATVKMIILRDMGDDDEDEDEDDEEDLEMADLLDDGGDDDDEDSPNGEGPSDPKRSPKEMKKNALAKALKGDEDDVLANGITAKGKAKVTSDEELDDDEDDDEKIAEGAVEYVLCTLDPDSVSAIPTQ